MPDALGADVLAEVVRHLRATADIRAALATSTAMRDAVRGHVQFLMALPFRPPLKALPASVRTAGFDEESGGGYLTFEDNSLLASVNGCTFGDMRDADMELVAGFANVAPGDIDAGIEWDDVRFALSRGQDGAIVQKSVKELQDLIVHSVKQPHPMMHAHTYLGKGEHRVKVCFLKGSWANTHTWELSVMRPCDNCEGYQMGEISVYQTNGQWSFRIVRDTFQSLQVGECNTWSVDLATKDPQDGLRFAHRLVTAKRRVELEALAQQLLDMWFA